MIKALHPADGEVKGTQLTTGQATQTVCMEFTGYVDVQKPPVATGDTWSCVIDLFQNPIAPVVLTTGTADFTQAQS